MIKQKMLQLFVLLMAMSGAMAYCGEQEKISLEKTWEAQPVENAETFPDNQKWMKTAIPGNLNAFKAGADGKSNDVSSASTVCIRTEIDVPKSWDGKKVVLNAPNICFDAVFYVNGTKAGEIKNLDNTLLIPDGLLSPGKNTIMAFVTKANNGILKNHPDDKIRLSSQMGAKKETIPLRMESPFELEALRDDVYMDNVFFVPSFRKKNIAVKVETNRKLRGTDLINIDFIPLDGDGKIKNIRIPAGKAREIKIGKHGLLEITSEWADAREWNAGAPFLYKVEISVIRDNRDICRKDIPRFGFREIWRDGKTLYLNGKVLRLKPMIHFDLRDRNTLRFFQGMGFNCIEFQPHEQQWFRLISNPYLGFKGKFDLIDEEGMLGLAPACHTFFITNNLLGDEVQDQLFEYTYKYIARLNSHPGIIFWCGGMNQNLDKGQWDSDHLVGSQPGGNAMAVKYLDITERMMKEIDPSRLVYFHACGNVADMPAHNFHIGMSSPQERAEWVLNWSRNGVKPVSMIEYVLDIYAPDMGYKAMITPEGNIGLGGEFHGHGHNSLFLTEIIAQYFGDAAYAAEKKDYVNHLGKTAGIGASRSGDSLNGLYGEFRKMFIEEVCRSWRAMGLNGGALPWIWGGKVWGSDKLEGLGSLATPYSAPSWASPEYKAMRNSLTPLIMIISGKKDNPADKSAAYYGDEKITQYLHIVFDGPGSIDGAVKVSVQNCGVSPVLFPRASETSPGTAPGKTAGLLADSFSFPVKMDSGDIKVIEIPLNRKPLPPGEYMISADLEISPVVKTERSVMISEKIHTDKRVSIIKNEHIGDFKKQIFLYDPGKSLCDWADKRKLKYARWEKGQNIPTDSILVIGTNALRNEKTFPVPSEYLKDGLDVIVLEQDPRDLMRMGFRITDIGPQYSFSRMGQQALGAQYSLENWRGSAARTVLPDGEHLSYCQHPLYVNSHHSVAQNIIEIPHKGGFRALAVSGFDLKYSPLMEIGAGKGRILFSQYALLNRGEESPRADNMLSRILKYCDTPAERRRTLKIYA
ncbi:MAG: hypothetical protein WAX69_19045, partial [Victivallales bacterium]